MSPFFRRKQTGFRGSGRRRLFRAAASSALIVVAAGCGSATWLRNGFLDPAQQGRFENSAPTEIRGQVTILEEPFGIQDAEEPTSEDLIVRYEEIPIAPGDQVLVSILDLLAPGQRTDQQFIVRGSGFETFTEIGPVRVARLTPRELELELQHKLRELGIFPPDSTPSVQVSVLRSEAMQFSVFGRVVQPGNYPLARHDFRLTNAVAAFGGIPEQTETIYVIRSNGRDHLEELRAPQPDSTTEPAMPEEPPAPLTLSDASNGAGAATSQVSTEPATKHAPPGGGGIDELEILEGRPRGELPPPRFDPQTGEWIIDEAATQTATAASEPTTLPESEAEPPADLLEPAVRVIEIPTKPLLAGDPRYNIVIRPGDTINVPPGIVGEYFMNGNVLRPGAYELTGRRLTAKQAIAAAGGFGPLAWPSRAELVRRISAEEEQTIQIDLDAIFSGHAPDFYVRPDDMINVGSNALQSILAVVRNAFRLSYGFGFVYDRNFADSDTFQAREQVKSRRQLEAQSRGLPF